MKICIVVHSYTGHTYHVALALEDRLAHGGHQVQIERATPVGGELVNQSDLTKIAFDCVVNTALHDGFVIAFPVRGFRASPVIQSYLRQIGSFQGKSVAVVATAFFPYQWMGGNQAIAHATELCVAKDADVLHAGVVNWSHSKRDMMIEHLVASVGSLF